MDTAGKDAILAIKPYHLPKLKTYKKIVNEFVIDEVELDQSYYWTSPWQEGERQADKDIQKESWDSFSSPEEAIEYLHKLTDDSNKTD